MGGLIAEEKVGWRRKVREMLIKIGLFFSRSCTCSSAVRLDTDSAKRGGGGGGKGGAARENGHKHKADETTTACSRFTRGSTR